MPYNIGAISHVFLSACADAYLTPKIKKYVQGFSSGFKDLNVSLIAICVPLRLYTHLPSELQTVGHY